MTEWPQVLEDIKSQLITKCVEGEYLEGFNIYTTDDVDATDLGPLTPYCIIILDSFLPDGFVSGRFFTNLSFTFRFATQKNRTTIKDVDYQNDKLIYYILKHHQEFLNTMSFTTANVTIFERPVPTVMQAGEENDPSTQDILHTGLIQWTVSVLNEVL